MHAAVRAHGVGDDGHEEGGGWATVILVTAVKWRMRVYGLAMMTKTSNQ